MAAFGDVCIVHQNDSRETEILISKAVQLGYETIAISSTFRLTNTKKGKSKTACPQAIDWNETTAVKAMKKDKKNLQVLNRLTIALEEHSQIHHLGTEAVLAYDILAVRPATEKLFQQCCGSLDVDLITVDLTSRLPFYVKLPQVGQAIERGIHFEINYSPAIRDNTQRRYIISNAMELVRTSKGRNIIVSSEAESVMDLRGPYDVANLGKLFGLKEEQCKAAVSRNIRALLYHAKVRKTTEKSAIGGCLISSVKKSEIWKLGRRKKDFDNKDKRENDSQCKNESDEGSENDEVIPPKKKLKSA